jgi:hypothetical protein
MEDAAKESGPSSILDPPSSLLPSNHSQFSPQRALGWAAFLGCSWTWCIGMFLPVLLVRDFGIWGWIVFAIPNVIGAAAMGWVIRSPEQSEQIVRAHAPAMRWFSIVTIAFQLFFAVWFFSLIAPGAGKIALIVLVVVFACLWITAMRSNRPAIFIAIVVLLISVGCFFYGLVSGVVPKLPAPIKPSYSLIPLALVCTLGFFTCPYLDLTFHRARRSSPSRAESHLAFGAGFGLFFLAMILFTLAYGGIAHQGIRTAAAIMLLVHMTAQLGFTVAAHLHEIEPRIDLGWRTMLGFCAAIICGMLALGSWTLSGLEIGELIYRLFMGFYGLVFPAYVGLCMLGSPVNAPSKSLIRGLWITVVLACPFYFLGFVQGRMMWLIGGILILLISRGMISLARLRWTRPKMT